MSARLRHALVVPDELLESLAELAAEIVLRRLERASTDTSSPYLTVTEAAERLRCKPQRIYDLLSARQLTRHKDGRRVLISRAELDAYLVAERRSSIARVLPPPTRMGVGIELSV